ncbi:MAG: Ig-like domain-containing protein [Oscillospiraceae bacterium]|nr:Ig-like domain-containing protein [Oscillospiraceae bacterium]
MDVGEWPWIRDVEVEQISFPESHLTVGRGDSIRLEAIISPDDATDQTLIWASSDSNIARVNSIGIVTGVSIGTATITATANDESEARASITIEVHPTTVTDLNPGDFVTYSISRGGFIIPHYLTGSEDYQRFRREYYTGTWQVLRVSSENQTIQIVSTEPVLEDLELVGISGYNNLITTLNSISGHYINPDYALTAYSARSLGSLVSDVSTSVGERATITVELADDEEIGLRRTDNNYMREVEAMEDARIDFATEAWLASRASSVNPETGVTIFSIRVLTAAGVRTEPLVTVSSGGNITEHTVRKGVYPVISLRPDLRVVDSGRRIDGRILWELVPDRDEEINYEDY